jgi:hypothetical protein
MTRLARWWSLKHAQKLGDTETRAVMNGDFWVGEEWR